MRSVEYKIDRLQQYMGFFAENCEVFLRLRGENTHPLAGPVYTQNGYEIRFSSDFICPQGFANIVFVARCIQQIIRNLVGEAKIVGEAGKRLPLGESPRTRAVD